MHQINKAATEAVDLARMIREQALASDPISMTYEEVRPILNAKELEDIAVGIEEAVARRNEAEILILELLHVLASPNPHASLVEEKLREDNNIFERGREFLGVELDIAGTIGATNG